MGRDTLKTMTRSEFVTIAEAMLAEFEDDHEECTGVSSNYRMPLINWWHEIKQMIENNS